MAKSKARMALEFVRREAARAATATDLHNVFFGNGGRYGKLFPTREEREAFSRTPEYKEIVRIQDELDERTEKAAARS
jgi:hypothetical protein